MALLAITSLIGKTALRVAIHDVMASLATDAISVRAVRDYAQRLEAERRPQILGVSSETWYAFRLADGGYWARANQLLADDLGLRVPRTYFRSTGRTGALPFVLTVQGDREGVLCNFRRAPRSAGFDRAELRGVVREAVRDSMKMYIRAAASGQMVGD